MSSVLSVFRNYFYNRNDYEEDDDDDDDDDDDAYINGLNIRENTKIIKKAKETLDNSKVC